MIRFIEPCHAVLVFTLYSFSEWSIDPSGAKTFVKISVVIQKYKEKLANGLHFMIPHNPL